MQYSLPNDHFCCVDRIIRYRSTEQHLKSHGNEILFINKLFDSAVMCESRQEINNTQELHWISIISSVPYFRAMHLSRN